jgi:undecaprenyl-diphosphatase
MDGDRYMLEWLIGLDHTLFWFINRSLANPVTDAVMPVITNDNLLRIVLAVGLLALIIFGRTRYLWVVLLSLALVAVTDQAVSTLLKPLIARPRPCRMMEVHLLVGCGPGYSFPSSHAANLFGQAAFFGLLFRKYLPYLAAFAFLVGVSRIFVGVHYPLDVAAGMLIGCSIGFIFAWLVLRLQRIKMKTSLFNRGSSKRA